MKRLILVHYSEIGLKGKNRPFFERILRDNLHAAGREFVSGHPRKGSGHYAVPLKDGADAEEAAARLARLPGVAWLAIAREIPLDIEAMESGVLERATEDEGSFRIDARRTDKTFPMNSVDINRRIGAAVVQATGRPVRLDDPDSTYGIEVGHDRAYLYLDRVKGIGGLPVGVSGRVIGLLSGGIDSPVAAWKMMRRGCRVVFVHFFNDTEEREGVRDKITEIGEILSRVQGPTRIHVVPFGDVQRRIIQHVPSKYRMLVYRRTMFRMAERFRREERAGAFVTGDSVGQVASQTLPSIRVVQAAASAPVLTPLAGDNKEEIVDLARRIGTYETSILPYQDCCSFLVSPHPVTRATVEEVEALETFEMDDEVRAALDRTEVLRLGPRHEGDAPSSHPSEKEAPV